MKTKNIIFLASLVIFGMIAVPVLADGSSCTNQYGGTVTCPDNELVINKKVRYPTNVNLFVENLTKNDAAYSPNDEVEYDVAVTNTSDVNYQTVTVIDQFPSQVTFVAGPGRYDAAANKLTYEISDLDAGETVHNRILVKVKEASVFAKDVDLTCDIVNTVNGTGPDGMSDSDTSSLCVRTKVLGTTTLPVAGFEDWMVVMPFAVIGVLGMALLIRKERGLIS